ncbi:hypothetical protein [Echinicola rosea]|uniref:hypothetical protein n=1 Tax=Echinicola rosea TaxID=1807691 RepID=UPI0010CA85F5|nr:hypothetical protein [Echinicola rosea]
MHWFIYGKHKHMELKPIHNQPLRLTIWKLDRVSVAVLPPKTPNQPILLQMDKKLRQVASFQDG